MLKHLVVMMWICPDHKQSLEIQYKWLEIFRKIIDNYQNNEGNIWKCE